MNAAHHRSVKNILFYIFDVSMRFRNTQSLILFAIASRHKRFSLEPHKSRSVGQIQYTDITMALCSSSTPKCTPCSGLDDSAKLSVGEAKKDLAALGKTSSIWTLNESQNGVLSLSRKFTARNFQAAIDAINDIGAIAENENHHPDLHLTNYRDVEIEIYTHKVNGLTQNDIILAGKINSEVTIEYSPKWLRENPAAMPTSKSNKGSS